MKQTAETLRLLSCRWWACVLDSSRTRPGCVVRLLNHMNERGWSSDGEVPRPRTRNRHDINTLCRGGHSCYQRRRFIVVLSWYDMNDDEVEVEWWK